MSNILEKLAAAGFTNLGAVFWNLPTPSLVEEAVRQRNGFVAHLGPLVVRTGRYTGLSPGDRYIVADPAYREKVWWGASNHPLLPEKYRRLKSRVQAYLQCRPLYIQDLFLGADTAHRVSLRVITEEPWHALFARNMFIRETDLAKLRGFEPDYTLIYVPNFRAIPDLDGTLTEVFVILNIGQREILIGGTSYAGNLKAAVFTLENFLLPSTGGLPLRASANCDANLADTSLFLGLSGTGKSSLGIDGTRILVADDAVAWTDDGISGIEGGGYAKVLHLSGAEEPEIYETTRMFGTILENVSLHPETRRFDLDDPSLTENTRSAFPITHIRNATRAGRAGAPRRLFLLTADMHGVLPPLAKLSAEQAIYHFLLGYSATLAGTEEGVREPRTTFCPCYCAPFLALSPHHYAAMLGERMARHGTEAWLLNTGWIGGAGEGKRIPLSVTRALVRAVHAGRLAGVRFSRDPVFGLGVPDAVPGVPEAPCDPRAAWKDPVAFDEAARGLARRFSETFRNLGEDIASPVRAAGPPGV